MFVKTGFEFTFGLWRQALSLYRRHSTSAQIYWAVCFWLFPALAATCWTAWLYLHSRMDLNAARHALVWASVFSIWFAIAVINYWGRIKKNYKATFPANTPSRSVEVQLSEDGIFISIAESLSSKLEWRSISNWSQNEEIFLVYINKSRFMPIPRKGLNIEEDQAIRSILQTHVGKQ